jgi:hypothetical protein
VVRKIQWEHAAAGMEEAFPLPLNATAPKRDNYNYNDNSMSTASHPYLPMLLDNYNYNDNSMSTASHPYLPMLLCAGRWACSLTVVSIHELLRRDRWSVVGVQG